jgi:hypothetical protein
MTKRKISLVLVLSMLLTIMIPTIAFGAVDYSGHWAEKTIKEWFDNDMLKGYEDGSFRPDMQVTRAEFMTMVNNAFEYTEKAEINFSDIKSSDWYYPEVQKAVKAGYLLGYEDNTARPGDKITRQEAALIIARIKNLSNYAAGANKFTDVAEIASWAIGGVGAAADKGYMIGYEDITFRPLRFISRAEALVTIDRALDKAGEETPGGGGGNSGGGGGKDPEPAITPSAIYYSFAEGDYVKADTTTSAAITTTSTAIYVKVVTYEGEAVTIGHSTTSSAITPTAIEVTTSSAIGGGTAHQSEIIELVGGDNFIYININDDEPFILHVIREEI